MLVLLPSSGKLNPFKSHNEEFLSLQLTKKEFPTKCFGIFPPRLSGCSEGLDVFRLFFKNIGTKKYQVIMPSNIYFDAKVLQPKLAHLIL